MSVGWPSQCNAVIMAAPGAALEYGTVMIPEPEPGAMLLETLYSEVCGTDVHLWHGRLAGVPYPIIPGHVSVGRVAHTDGTASDLEGERFAVGDMVTFLDVHETCGHCWQCLVGKNTTRCPSRKVYGITYGAGNGPLGGWSEFIYLKPGVKAIRLPGELEPDAFIGGGCGAPTAFHAVQRAAIKLNDTVVVQGTGPVGLSAIAFARISGAGTVIAIGAPDDRLQLARQMGADVALSIETRSFDECLREVRGLTGGRGADVVIEATGVPIAVSQGMDLARDAGTLVVVGQYTDCGEVPINPHLQINKKHLDIRGCWGSDFSHFYGAVQTMARHQGNHPWRDLAAWKYPLKDAGRALADIEARKVPKAVIAVSRSV